MIRQTEKNSFTSELEPATSPLAAYCGKDHYRENVPISFCADLYSLFCVVVEVFPPFVGEAQDDRGHRAVIVTPPPPPTSHVICPAQPIPLLRTAIVEPGNIL
jgi:hypothetical protein